MTGNINFNTWTRNVPNITFALLYINYKKSDTSATTTTQLSHHAAIDINRDNPWDV
jgi:hypothetical protein